MEQQEIEKRICAIATAMDFGVSENISKIARLKAKMVDWRICPCDRANVHRYCGSRQCENDVEEYGKCHCGLYLRVDKGDKIG